MAVKSVITVDLDTAAFDKFKSAFDAFSDQVQKVRVEARQIGGGFGGVASVWREAASHAQSFAGYIASATASILKWGSILGGLVGVGSLWGLDRLAIAAGEQRRLALGLGASPGEIRGFGATYGRVVDPGQFLGAVNQALTDVQKRVGLYGAGLTEADIRGRDTGQVAAELLPALKRLADQTPTSLLGQVLSARHLDQFIGLEDFQRLKNTPLAEINSYQQQYQARRRDLELTKQQQKAWQDLQVQLHFAGLSIEQTLIRGLTPLAPQIERLSKSFTDLVDAFLKSPTVKGWIDDLSAGLETFARYIGTPEFKSDVGSFVSGIGRMAISIKGWLQYFGVLSSPNTGGEQFGPPIPPARPFHVGPQPSDQEGWSRWRQWQDDLWNALPPHVGRGGTAPNGVPRTGPLFGPQNIHPGAFRPGASGSRVQEAHDFFRYAGWSEAQTAGLLAYVGGESGFNPTAFNPAGGGQGARGIGQWRGERIEAFRRLFGHDPLQGTYEEQLAFVQWELTHTETAAAARLRAAGSAAEAGAAVTRYYGRGEAGLEGRRGAAATQYQQQFKDRSVTVTIQNNTGGNANVSVAQLAT